MHNTLREVNELVDRSGGSAAFFISHSGGKDSTRMMGRARKHFPEITTYAVMADTGFAHQSPISGTDFARARCAEFNVELTVVRNPRRNISKWWSSAAIRNSNIGYFDNLFTGF